MMIEKRPFFFKMNTATKILDFGKQTTPEPAVALNLRIHVSEDEREKRFGGSPEARRATLRDGAVVAHGFHNPRVAGSSPAPATRKLAVGSHKS